MKARYLLIVLLASIFTSCDITYVDRPIPVDSKTLKKIPNKYHGEWELDDHTTRITKNMVSLSIHHKKELSKTNDEIKHVEKGGEHFIVDGQEGIIKTKSFRETGDSVFYTFDYEMKFSIGHNLIVKSFNEGIMLNTFLPIENGNQGWWTPYYLVSKGSHVLYYSISSDSDYSLLDESRIFPKRDYFQADWTEEDVLELFNNGAFALASDTLFIK